MTLTLEVGYRASEDYKVERIGDTAYPTTEKMWDKCDEWAIAICKEMGADYYRFLDNAPGPIKYIMYYRPDGTFLKNCVM